MPLAISENGGHDALFAVACVLVHGFDLPEPEAWLILCEYNARCQPPWSERELRHKLRSAGQLTRHPKPRGYLRDANVEQEYLPNSKNPKAVKWQVTPEPLPATRSRAPPESHGVVDLDRHGVGILRGFSARASGKFVIEGGALAAGSSLPWRAYRCGTWRRLIAFTVYECFGFAEHAS